MTYDELKALMDEIKPHYNEKPIPLKDFLNPPEWIRTLIEKAAKA